MIMQESMLHAGEGGSRAAGRRPARASSRRAVFSRLLAAAVFAAALMLGPALTASAQEVTCLPLEQDLKSMPEIVSQDGKLRGTIMLIDVPARVSFRQQYTIGQPSPTNQPITAPNDNAPRKCFVQRIRQFRVGTGAPVPVPAPNSYTDPMPGPTLRARVGDLVQLTFINQIDPSNFGDSIDRAERTGNRGGGCDESSAGYPNNVKDKFPDCFHGSSTGNIHFHGTHTNPNGTGDNVFIEVRPSLREDNKPVVTQESVRRPFDEFFAQCEAKLKSATPLREWPKSWADMPNYWTEEQEKLLKRYDREMEKNYPGSRKLWPIDSRQVAQGVWPQYYVGAFPYCFRLPEYVAPLATNAGAGTGGGMGTGTGRGAGTGGGGGTGAGTGAGGGGGQQPVSGGAGTAELGHTALGGHGETQEPLHMGQAPGTHWYHAHKHGSTAINVANGMTGVFIIEGREYDDALNAFYGTPSTPLWTRSDSTRVMMINQIGVTPNLVRGAASRIDKGPDFSVNGLLRPTVSMRPGEVQMWRIANASGRAGVYFTGPPAGFEWKQLAQDGVQFHNDNYDGSRNKKFLMAAGNRVDLLVKAPSCANPDGCKYPVMVQNAVDMTDLAGASAVTLLTVKVSGEVVSAASNAGKFISPAPTPPPFLNDIQDSEVTGTKVMRFGSKPPFSGPAQHTIDGQQFDGEVGAVVLLNRVEEWKIFNESYGPLISHPFHIHINPFQVTEVFSPNDPLIDPKTGKAPIDPKTKKPYVDPQTNKPAVKYAFRKDNLAPGQCYLNPDDPSSWKPCGPAPPKTNLIWWDVFPIPSGYAPVKVQLDAKGNPVIDPKTKKVVTTPLVNKQGQPLKVPGHFKMRSRFVDYSGFYVIHCHILAHEDRGMMTIVEVAPARTPYSHH